MTRQCTESRRRFIGLTAALGVFGLTGTSIAGADEPDEDEGNDDPDVFEVSLEPGNVVSDEDVESDATGEAMAVLDGDRLVIGGEFADLTSPLRDVADYEGTDADAGIPEEEEEDEEDENGEEEGDEEEEEENGDGDGEDEDPDQEEVVEDLLDPGIHIHEGDTDETTGYILALVAHLDTFSDTGARYAGSFTLTDSQIATLRDEEFYQDVHSEEFEDGEVRDQLTPADEDVELFDAELTGDEGALGAATAFLADQELVVGGEFSGLRSRLANQTESVLEPGITIYDDDEAVRELVADIEDDEGSGQFAGSYELDDEEIDRLGDGEFSIEIATEDHPDGVASGDLDPR
jgi:hypothetical protein